MIFLQQPHEEVSRLRHHFANVLAELRGASTAHLRGGRARERASLIRELDRYAKREQFPKNRDRPGELVPYFVDADGTHCAVGELMRVSKAGRTIERIRTSDNHVLIDDIAGDAELLAFLDQAGLTPAEAARIQPSYCSVTMAEACLCIGPLDTAFTAEIISVATEPATDLEGVVQVQAIYGTEELVAIGDQLTAYLPDDAAVGQVVLAFPGQDGAGVIGLLDDAGAVHCRDLSVDGAIAAQALVSGECSDTLIARDEAWGESQCRDEDSTENGGCQLAAGSAFGAELVAAALVVVVMRARVNRRSR